MALKQRNSLIGKLLDSTQNRTYTVLAVTVIVIVAMFAAAIVPAYLSVSNQLVENNAKRKYIDEMDNYLDNLKSLAEQEIEYSDEIKLFEEYYPNKSNDEFFLSNISAMATKFNCSLVSISFDKQTQEQTTSNLTQFANITRRPITLTIVGELPSLQLFLSQIEQFPAVINVNKISYTNKIKESAQAGEISPTTYQLSINAEYIYWNYVLKDE